MRVSLLQPSPRPLRRLSTPPACSPDGLAETKGLRCARLKDVGFVHAGREQHPHGELRLARRFVATHPDITGNRLSLGGFDR